MKISPYILGGMIGVLFCAVWTMLFFSTEPAPRASAGYGESGGPAVLEPSLQTPVSSVAGGAEVGGREAVGPSQFPDAERCGVPSEDRRLLPEESSDRAANGTAATPPAWVAEDLATLRAEVRALEDRLARSADSPYGRLLASKELERGGATLAEKRAVRAWLEEYPVTLTAGEGLWLLEYVRSGFTLDPCAFFGRARLEQELGPEKQTALCED
jgi:hypothetical protein